MKISKLKDNYFPILVSLLFTTGSCKKMIEIDPPVESIVTEDIYNRTESASSVLLGLFHDMSMPDLRLSFTTGNNSLSVNMALYGDELVNYTGFNKYFSNNLSEQDDDYWSGIYWAILRTNTAIEGITASKSLTDDVKHRLLGEAKFLRAFYYFYLVNLFGDVPLLTTSDYKANASAGRVQASQVFEQIILDLKDAQDMLGDDYVGSDILVSSSERARPNKSAATALLARVYLYNEQWQEAEAEASKVISNTSDYELVGLGSVFLKNSKEAIWQLQPVVKQYNTQDAVYFIPTNGSTRVNSYLTEQLLNKFDSTDARKTSWITQFQTSGLYYPYKYKAVSFNGTFEEYVMVLRLGEQYLIRAEARAHLDNLAGAKEDLFEIRKRAGLLDPIALDLKDEILNAIADERARELFTEWGHRWFDLKRTNKADEVMSTQKPLTWETTKQLLPIPQTEIEKNPSLAGHQNPGY